MNINYLIRLDDACATMDRSKWLQMAVILDRYGIKPMVGVIPHNEDPQQQIDAADEGFWDMMKEWEAKGWALALHGYSHCYTSNGGLKGRNPMWERSEFAGVPLEEQKEKIRKGVGIMREKGINPKYFFAPSHTFDENTLIALQEESDIRIISDTIGRYPYWYGGFCFVPQISGHCVKMPVNGIYTFCFHPNTMNDAAFENMEMFIREMKEHFISFADLNYNDYGKKCLVDKLLSWFFFKYRSLRGLK